MPVRIKSELGHIRQLLVLTKQSDLIYLRLTWREMENLILRIFGEILEDFWRFFEEFEEFWRKWFIVSI